MRLGLLLIALFLLLMACEALRSRLKTLFFHLIRLSSKWIMAI